MQNSKIQNQFEQLVAEIQRVAEHQLSRGYEHLLVRLQSQKLGADTPTFDTQAASQRF